MAPNLTLDSSLIGIMPSPLVPAKWSFQCCIVTFSLTVTALPVSLPSARESFISYVPWARSRPAKRELNLFSITGLVT